jgi:hypothetical protein
MNAKTAENEEERNACPPKVKEVHYRRLIAECCEITNAPQPWQLPMPEVDSEQMVKDYKENRHAAQLVDYLKVLGF